MSSEEDPVALDLQQLRDELDALNAAITKQGAQVRILKKEGGTAQDIFEAVAQLQTLKIAAAEKTAILEQDAVRFNRKTFDDLVLRKMFVVPSFEIHGGVKGLFDLGPPACALKVRSFWTLPVCAMYASNEACEIEAVSAFGLDISPLSVAP